MYKTTRDENSKWQAYEENRERLGSKLKIKVYFDLINTQQCFDERNTQDVKTFEEKKLLMTRWHLRNNNHWKGKRVIS